eukprot:GHVN01098138.1.p1 GENE.GHVN01098138.1~~GHVN01098138.1.p1  ORF type:complete len:477 (-),score=54.84 GHVN01098138.1:15-1445(-)
MLLLHILQFVFVSGAAHIPEKQKTICCIGGGYVGGTTGVVIAAMCPECTVYIVDNNKERIDMWNGPKMPIYEEGLTELVLQRRNKNLFFTTDLENPIKNSGFIFLCVNTPTKEYGMENGTAHDLVFTEMAIDQIVKHSITDKIIIEKSTVPSKTAEKIRNHISAKNTRNLHFDILSSPEFLAQGTAIKNLLHPDRILIGSFKTKEGLEAEKKLKEIYLNWVPEEKIITTDIWTSELGKLASNAFLSQKISSINALSELCEKVGGDITSLSKIVGTDSRIGPFFLNASLGFGGSCFEKDVLCLVYLCEYYQIKEAADYWRSVISINEHQKKRFAKKVVSDQFSTISGKKIAVLGFAFKKNTDDTRKTPAADVVKDLLSENAFVSVYDPVVKEESIYYELGPEYLNSKRLKIEKTLEAAVEDANALVIATEWNVFTELDYHGIYQRMKKPAFIFDGRNILDKENLGEIGFIVSGIGRN